MENNENNKKTKGSPLSENSAGTVAIVVVGLFVIFVVFFLGKGLFTSNSKDVPEGLDTETINTDITDPKPDNDSAAPVNNDISSSADSASENSSQTESKSDDSSQAEDLGTMYVTEYAYLHTAPDNEAENIVCMSPGVEVTVLNFEDNGYVKITFQNIDGPLTGYIYKDYLASYDAQVSQAENYSDQNGWQDNNDDQNNWQGEDDTQQNNWQNDYTDQNGWQ